MAFFTRLSFACLFSLSVIHVQAALTELVAPANGLTLSDPTYDCATRQLTIRASGGNGSPIEYMVAGQTRWSASPTVVLDPVVVADAAPLTLLARQATGGNAPEIARRSFNVATVCGGGKAEVDPKVGNGPAKNTGLTLADPTYNCGTRQLTIQASGGNGATIEYMVAGQTRWANSASVTLDPVAVNDAPVLMVFARQQSETGTPFIVNKVIDLGARCGGTKASPPAIDASPTGLSLGTPTFNCTSRELTIRTVGGNGNPVEYLIVGQGRWSTSATTVIEPSAITSNGTVVVLARQKNGQGVPTNVQQSVNTLSLCGGR